MQILMTFGLFVITAIAEIVGCYLPYLWLNFVGCISIIVIAILIEKSTPKEIA